MLENMKKPFPAGGYEKSLFKQKGSLKGIGNLFLFFISFFAFLIAYFQGLCCIPPPPVLRTEPKSWPRVWEIGNPYGSPHHPISVWWGWMCGFRPCSSPCSATHSHWRNRGDTIHHYGILQGEILIWLTRCRPHHRAFPAFPCSPVSSGALVQSFPFVNSAAHELVSAGKQLALLHFRLFLDYGLCPQCTSMICGDYDGDVNCEDWTPGWPEFALQNCPETQLIRSSVTLFARMILTPPPANAHCHHFVVRFFRG